MNKVNWKDDIRLKNIVLESISKKGVLITLGVKPGSGNYRTLNKYIKLFNIDISHFEAVNFRSIERGKFVNMIPDEEIFIENSSYNNGSALKKRLLDGGYLDYKCSECGIEDIWKDKPLVLQLEHKNGIRLDNRIKNLTFLCPNCHSQTLTYAGRNNKSYHVAQKRKKEKALELERKRLEKITPIIKTIQKADIVFHKYGWVNSVSEIIGCKPQKVNKWMKQNMPEFYEEKCFKRKNNNGV